MKLGEVRQFVLPPAQAIQTIGYKDLKEEKEPKFCLRAQLEDHLAKRLYWTLR